VRVLYCVLLYDKYEGVSKERPKDKSVKEDWVAFSVYSPERSRDTVGPGNVRRLEKSGSPSPLADNDRGSQTGLDHSTSGAVRFEKNREK
jgi:hypothetical protein